MGLSSFRFGARRGATAAVRHRLERALRRDLATEPFTAAPASTCEWRNFAQCLKSRSHADSHQLRQQHGAPPATSTRFPTHFFLWGRRGARSRREICAQAIASEKVTQGFKFFRMRGPSEARGSGAVPWVLEGKIDRARARGPRTFDLVSEA